MIRMYDPKVQVSLAEEKYLPGSYKKALNMFNKNKEKWKPIKEKTRDYNKWVKVEIDAWGKKGVFKKRKLWHLVAEVYNIECSDYEYRTRTRRNYHVTRCGMYERSETLKIQRKAPFDARRKRPANTRSWAPDGVCPNCYKRWSAENNFTEKRRARVRVLKANSQKIARERKNANNTIDR